LVAADAQKFSTEENMQGVSGMGGDVFGLYELSRDGTILYSRPRREDGLRDPEQAIIGQDFFRDIFPCLNMEDLRRHFRRFITGEQSVDTFVFECMFEREVIKTKIFMTRAYENDHDHTGGIVIMDIRRAS
jgi:hypothetical protein